MKIMTKYYINGSGFDERISRAMVANEDGKEVNGIKSTEKSSIEEMEYRALIMALITIKYSKDSEAVIFISNLLVHSQLLNEAKIKSLDIKMLNEEARKLLKETGSQLVLIPYEDNLAVKLIERDNKKHDAIYKSRH